MYTTEELKKIYEGRYSDVDQSNAAREEALYRKYRRLLFGSEAFEKVLDLGCGVGFKTTGFTHPNEIVVAIDLSENAVNFCKANNKIQNIEFKAVDAMKLNEKFNLITAFGFSLFNTKSIESFTGVFEHFYKQNIVHKSASCLIIGSFTDFSGRGEDSWYLHTKKDLADIICTLEGRFSVKVSVYFPHRHVKNYFGFGMYNFGAELFKLFSKRKKTFFIRIDYE